MGYPDTGVPMIEINISDLGGVYIARCSDCPWYSASGDIDVSRASKEHHAEKHGHDVYLELVLEEG